MNSLPSSTPDVDVYQTEKIARNTLKASRWIALGLTLAIFLVPQVTIVPAVAGRTARSTHATLETIGLPIQTSSGISEYRKPAPKEVDLLVKETYDTSIPILRFFCGFGSFMAFLIFWWIFASPTLRSLQQSAIAAQEAREAFELEMLSTIREPLL